MLQFPADPPQAVLDYFRAKGFKLSFDHRDVWREEHAFMFTVAKAMSLDLLGDIREAVDEAIEKGVPFAQFKAQLTSLLIQQGWWGKQDMIDPATGQNRFVQLGSPRRLQTIYDVNLRTANAAGQWQRIEKTQSSHPYLLYLLGSSREHRLEHVRLNGLCLPVAHPFWNKFFPPNGWGCKCHVRAISQREYDRLNSAGKITTEAPEIEMIDWENKRTGEVSQIPKGIDPGWDVNHGKTRQQTLQNKLQEAQL
jgi:uncharacterized protein with gpF-like domain